VLRYDGHAFVAGPEGRHAHQTSSTCSLSHTRREHLVEEDGPPTLPSLRRLRRYVTGAAGAYGESSGSSTWATGRRLHRPSASYKRLSLILGASLVVNVVLLVVLLSVLVLDHGGFSQRGIPVGSSSSVSRVTNASPKAGIATPTAAPVDGWLQVTPTTLQLSCNNGQQTQFVVLRNTGTEPVQWRVIFLIPADQVGVNVTPNQGTLNAGASMPLQIQNQTDAHGPQGAAGQQGTIEFNPEVVAAGPPPNITYSTVGCS
jgi:hypothetical protein